MEFSFSQEIRYSNKERLTVANVANSLLALEKIAKVTPLAVERIYEGTNVRGLEIYIENLETGSLIEKIQYYINIGVQDKFKEIIGFNAPYLEGSEDKTLNNLIAFFLALLVLNGMQVAADRVFPDKPKENIQNEINITLNIGEQLTGLNKETLYNYANEIIRLNPSLPRDSIDFTRPAKNDPEASITIDKKFIISDKAIKESPDLTVAYDEGEISKKYEKTEVIIRATDKDYSGRGWGAVVPEFSEKRIRMQVDPIIDLKDLAHEDSVIGDLVIFYQIDFDGNIIKAHAHLSKIHEDSKISGE